MSVLTENLAAQSDFMPHGYCFAWDTNLLWLNLGSDILTGLAYYAIAGFLVYFVSIRRDVPFNWIFILFGLFILTCGTTHFMSAWTVYVPSYWAEGGFKGLNASVSILTAILLLPLAPKLIALPSLQRALDENSALSKTLRLKVTDLQNEVGRRKQVEITLERTNRVLRTLSRCNGVLIHAEDETQLLCDICQAIIEEGGYRLAWVGHAEHDKAKHVRPVAEAGFDEGYLESLNITWDDKKCGRGPAGTAIRNREPSIAQNIQDDPRFSPWREAALKHGYESCIALPIMVDNEVFGALIVYASEPYAFNEDEVNLLTELAGDIAFGISRLRMRARRLQAEEALQKSERQYHEIIKTARDAFVSMDADGIITDWNPQAEAIFGWRRAEILGQPVSETIVPPEYSKKHTQGLKHYLATGKGPILNQSIEINAQHRDGHTFPVELSIVPIQTNGAKRFNAFIRDISARQKARKALKASLVGTIVAISRAVEARDPYTAGHQQRVARLARCIAQEMDMDSERIDGLRMGATIHDIGKIYLPAEILSKPSKLTETEFKLIKTHCQVGYDILKDIEFPWPVANIAYQHHERLDGTGYPQGLKGDEICLEARIVAVADVIEAISSHRPYRPALGIDVALEEIETHRGEWYEPAAVDACLKLIREKEFSFDDNRSN